jgi:pteridine reductase
VGRSIVEALAMAGANVVVHHHTSRAEADETVRAVRDLGCDAVAIAADLRDARAVRDLAEEADSRSGGLSVLVNSASNYLHTPWETLNEAAWDLSLSVNLKAPYLLSLHLGTAMRRRGQGVIVNVADSTSERPQRGYLPYAVAKAGLVCLTRAVARELAPAVRVNAVAPGPVLLPEGTTPAAAEAIRRATPLGLGTPAAVGRAVRFLVEDATFTTGTVLLVDGGRAMA